MISYKSTEEIGLMREAGRLLARAFEAIESVLRDGVSGADLDRVAEDFIRSNGAEPAFKGYRGYPATICFSVNEGVVHGIPNGSRLNEGDLVSIDMGLSLNGFFADSARTYPIGDISKQAADLISTTRDSLDKGISECRVGNRLGDVSAAIQRYVEGRGFSVVRDLVGHGIGRSMHEEPAVPNFGTPNSGPILKEGMVLAIEPMVNMGTHEIEVLGDNWTVVTADHNLSAHFEHTVAIGASGPEVLTVSQ